MSEQETDPLDDIFVEEDEIDREALARILKPYITIRGEDGKVYPKPSYESLTSKKKVLVALAAQRAMAERGMVDSASLGPSAISELSLVKEGTVKPAVRDLADKGLIDDGEEGYSIVGPLLQRVEAYINDGE